MASIAYVDNLVAISTAGLGGGVGVAVTISDTSPGSPDTGDLWWDSKRGTGFVYYNDGSSSQWVEFCPGSGGGSVGGGSSEVTKVYVDNLVAISTSGLTNTEYVDNKVAISTAGLASEAYVDAQVAISTSGISTDGLASIVYVDNKVGLATVGLSSEGYVDNKVGLATVGLSSDLQSVTDLGDTTTATITANGFACNDVSISDGNIAITGYSNTLNYFTCTGKDNQVDFRVQKDHVKVGSTARNASLEIWGDVVGYSSITADRFYGQGLLPSRTIVSGTTASLDDLEIGNVDIEGFKSYNLMKVGLSTAGWLRLYTDSTSRANDASRSIGIDPAPGIGVIAEVVTTGVSTTQIISPFVAGGNLDEPATNTIYASVKNLTGQTSTISIDLTLLQLEE